MKGKRKKGPKPAAPEPAGARTKATRATVLRRVEEVLRIRLDGAEFWDVREYAREKEKEAGSAWEPAEGAKPLSDPTLWRYIARADGLIAESCRSSRKKLLRRHRAQRRNLYAKAVLSGDYRTALAVLDSEAKLLGLFAPTKIAPTNPDGTESYAPLTDDERRGILAAVFARLGVAAGAAAGGGPGDAG
jgi:hypothetical protein